MFITYTDQGAFGDLELPRLKMLAMRLSSREHRIYVVGVCSLHKVFESRSQPRNLEVILPETS